MNIVPVKMNCYTRKNQNINKNKPTTPAFRGEQTQSTYKTTLEKLKKANSEIIVGFSKNKLDKCIDEMMIKYNCLGVKSVGLQIIGKEDITDFLGDNAKKYNTKDKFGICVAIGDKFGPVEQMNRIYEAKTFIVSEEELNNL